MTVAAALLLGFVLGPQGLALLSPSVLLALDPAVAMALATVGVFVGLNVDPRHPRLTLPLGIVVSGGLALLTFRDPAPVQLVFTTIAVAAAAIIVAIAGWLLVRQTDSEREQHVFVAGVLLLLGGAASYLSLSALFAGLAAGAVWSAFGDIAKARIVRDLEYLQHPLTVLMLLVAGASATLSLQVAVVALAIVAITTSARMLAVSTPVPIAIVATALAFDVFRGVGN